MKNMLIILTFFSFWGCHPKVQEEIFLTKRFEEVLSDSLSHKDLLFIVTNRDCIACSMLERFIEKDFELQRRLLDRYDCISYPADMIGYEFLSQLLCIYEFPLIVVMSRNGDVKSLVSGAKQSQEFLSLIQDSFPICNVKNRFFISDSNYIKLISLTTKAFQAYHEKNTLKAGELIEESINQYSYLYNLYLGAKIFQMKNDSLKAVFYANKALSINNEFDDFIYKNLKDELIYITGKNALFSSKPKTIAFKEQSYDCGHVVQNESLQFNFEFKNVDTVPVIIENIQKSCNCMDIIWDRHPILPGEKGFIKVKYNTSHLGYFTKVLFVNLAHKEKGIPLYIKGMIVDIQ